MCNQLRTLVLSNDKGLFQSDVYEKWMRAQKYNAKLIDHYVSKEMKIRRIPFSQRFQIRSNAKRLMTVDRKNQCLIPMDIPLYYTKGFSVKSKGYRLALTDNKIPGFEN